MTQITLQVVYKVLNKKQIKCFYNLIACDRKFIAPSTTAGLSWPDLSGEPFAMSNIY